MTSGEMDGALALKQLAAVEADMAAAEREAERYRHAKTQPVYAARRAVLREIPSFWYVVLGENRDFTDYLGPADLQYLEYVVDVYCEWSVEEQEGFALTFVFECELGAMELQTVTKRFWSRGDGSGGEELVSEAVEVVWPAAATDPKTVDTAQKEGRRAYRAAMRLWFAWFAWTGKKPGKEFRDGEAMARLVADDVFPYAVKYYTEALGGEGDDESSEELDVDEGEDEDEGEGEEDNGEPSAKRAKTT